MDFAAESEAAGMRIGTSKSKAVPFSQNRVDCFLRVRDELPPQVGEFKYLEREMDRWIRVGGTADTILVNCGEARAKLLGKLRRFRNLVRTPPKGDLGMSLREETPG